MNKLPTLSRGRLFPRSQAEMAALDPREGNGGQTQ